MPYIGTVTRGHAFMMDPTVEIIDTWDFDVQWKRESDGKLEHAYRVGSCSLRDTKAKPRLQRRLDDYVGRYAGYAKRKGIRYEVKCREKEERKRAKAKAEAAAKRKVMEAGPVMLQTLRTLLADFTSERTLPEIRNGLHVQLIRETIAKATCL